MNDLKFAFRQLLKNPASPPWPCSRPHSASERVMIKKLGAKSNKRTCPIRPQAFLRWEMSSIAEFVRTTKNQSNASRDDRNPPKVISRRLIGWLFLAGQLLRVVNAADQTSNEKEPQALDLLKMVAQARQRIAFGEMEFEVVRYEFTRPLDGTNRARLRVLFDGEKRRCEWFGREYAYVLMGPDADKVTDAKRQELWLDPEGSVRAGLLTGFDSHRVLAYDGKVLMDFPRAGALALMDPKQGSGSYVFEPRVLGLTTSPSVTDTVENCLAHSHANSVQVVGKEPVDGVVAWHIRVSYPSVTYDYWLDANHSSRVVKCGFNADMVFSKFDAATPDDPIPTEVRCVSFHGPERMRSEVYFLRRSARFDTQVEPACWTLAGLDLPAGTAVVDHRLSRTIGYWNGSGLSDNPPSGMAPDTKPKSPTNPAKLMELVEKDPRSLFAAHACFTLASLLKTDANEGSDERVITEAERLFQRAIAACDQAGAAGLKLAGLANEELFQLRQWGLGKVAQEIEGEDMDGRKVKLSDHRGRVVVLTFWATWCPPCMAMVPDERKLVERMAGKAFSLIGVNCDSDTDRTKVKAVMDKVKMTWPSFRDGGKSGPIATAWGVHNWPTIYVLDPKGVIRYRNVRGQVLAEAVDALMREGM